MKSKSHPWLRALFLVGGVYDTALGLTFLLFAPALFMLFDIEPPNHAAYIQLPALLITLFGVMFLQIARDPARNRNLIPYGCGLKACYCTVVFGHSWLGEIPNLWVPWAWADLVFLGLFYAAWVHLSPKSRVEG